MGRKTKGNDKGLKMDLGRGVSKCKREFYFILFLKYDHLGKGDTTLKIDC